MRLADNGATRVTDVADLEHSYITEVVDNFEHIFSGLCFFAFRKTL